MSKSKIVFFGTDAFSLPALKRLIAGGYDIAAVVTRRDSRAGRGQGLRQPPVKQIAEKAGVEVLQPERMRDIKDKLAGCSASHGVLAAYGKILPQEIIDIFPGGIVNIHPSLLPKYRGPSPIEAAILNGDTETGISLMKLTGGMDEGPLYAQKTIKLAPDIDRTELTEQLAEAGAGFLLEKLPGIMDRSIEPQPQNDSQATYTKLVKKEDGLVDWQKPAQQIEREVRAYAGWPKSRAKIGDSEVIITKARVASGEGDGKLVMRCQPGYIEVLKLLAPSGRTVSGANFIRGYKK